MAFDSPSAYLRQSPPYLPRKNSLTEVYKDQFLVNCAVFITVLAIIGILKWMEELFVPLLFAVFLYYLVNPIVNYLTVAPIQWFNYVYKKVKQGARASNNGGRASRSEYDKTGVEMAERGEKRGGSHTKGEEQEETKAQQQTETAVTASATDTSPLLPQSFKPAPSSSRKHCEKQSNAASQGQPSSPSSSSTPSSTSTSSSSNKCSQFYRQMKRKLPKVIKLPRWLAIVVALSIITGALFILFVYIVNNVSHLLNNFDKYEKTATYLQKQLKDLMRELGVDFKNDFVPYLMNLVRSLAGEIVSLALSSTEFAFVTLVFLLFFLMYPITPAQPLALSIDEQIRSYIVIKTLMSIIIGFCIAFVLFVLDVPIFSVFGFFAFVCNYIPNVGAVFSTLFPLPLVILDPDLTVFRKVLAIVLPGFIHFLWGNFLEPKIFGDRLDLHPIIVLIALGFWTIIWGTLGAILSVPLIAVARIILKEINHPLAQGAVGIMEGSIFENEEDKLTKDLIEDVESGDKRA